MENKYLDFIMQNLSIDSDTVNSDIFNSDYKQSGGSKKPDVNVPIGGVLPIYYCSDTDKKKIFEREHQKKKEFSGSNVGISIADILKQRKKNNASLEQINEDGLIASSASSISSKSSIKNNNDLSDDVKQIDKNTVSVKINYPWRK